MSNMQGTPKPGPGAPPSGQQSTMPLSAKAVLSCNYALGPNWYKKDYPANKTRLNITEDPHNSDIPTGIPNVQNLNVIFQKLGGEWYVIEASNTNYMTIDGAPLHQLVFKSGEKHVVCLDRVTFIFTLSTGVAEPKRRTEAAPGKDEFSLVQPKSTSGVIYSKFKPCIIGPNEFCDLRLQSETASAFIFSYKDCCFLKAISSSPENPVTADGVNAETPVPLFNDSKIAIGKYTAIFRVEQDAAIAKHEFKFTPEYKLERLALISIDEASNEKSSIPLPPAGKALNIGRDSHSDIHIEAKDISRKHAQMIIYERSALVFDCYSTNGTFVNGEKIAKRMLHPGDIVSFGDTAFLFCYLD